MSGESTRGGGIRRVLGVLIAVVAVGSIGMRAMGGEHAREGSGAHTSGSLGAPAGGSSLVDTTTAPGEHERDASGDGGDPWSNGLPVVTEASFFAMIGFALGYLAKKVVKLALIFLALIFVLLQTLSYVGVVTIDWSRAIELFNDFVLNLRENRSLGDVLRDRLPGAGGLVGGYLVGFRKG